METPHPPPGLDGSRYAALMTAAMTEFGVHGYLHASMARIAAGAGVSKALSFHYFDGKAGLFAHAYRRAIALLGDALDGAEPRPSDDLFSAAARSAAAKARLLATEEPLMRFLVSAWYDTAPEAMAARGPLDGDLMDAQRDRLMDLAGRTPLRPGVSTEDAVDLLLWTSEGFLGREVQAGRLGDPDMAGRFAVLLDVLKRGLTEGEREGRP